MSMLEAARGHDEPNRSPLSIPTRGFSSSDALVDEPHVLQADLAAWVTPTAVEGHRNRCH